MDIQLIVNEIYEEANYNPACFNFTEAEARKKKLWRDDKAMPTPQEMDDAWIIVQADLQVEKNVQEAKDERRAILKNKLKNGNATNEEIQEALNLIL